MRMRFNKGMVVKDPKQLLDVLEDLTKATRLAVDCETQAFSDETFHPWELALHGIGIYTPDAYGFILPEALNDESRRALDHLFSCRRLTFHNAKFDLQVLAANGFDVDAYSFDDTMVMSWLVDENRRTHKLKDLAHDLLKVTPSRIVKFKDLVQKPVMAAGTLFDEEFYRADYKLWLETTSKYCMDDCRYTWDLYHLLAPKLKEDELEYTYENLELPFVNVLRRMERKGVTVDVEYLKELGVKLDRAIVEARSEIVDLVGHDINPNSPVQLKQLFFDQLKYELPDDLKTKDGKVTTDAKALDYLADELGAPVAKTIKKYRELMKTKGTYVEGLLERQRDGVIHAGFHHTGTVTGRLSSSNPNLQNIPRTKKDGEFDIRRAFVARPGRKFVIGDYSQIELRLMAYYSQCPRMIEIYKNNGDIHKATADAVKCDRMQAKAINFGINYGMHAHTFSTRLNVSVQKAQAFIDGYFQAYPEVKQFMDRAAHRVFDAQQIRTLARRLRRFPEYIAAMKLGDRKAMNRTQRQACNSIIQGSAADVCKIAMRNLDRRLKKDGIKADVLIQVHDELIVEADEEHAELALRAVKEEMENAIKIEPVPLVVDPTIADRWTK